MQIIYNEDTGWALRAEPDIGDRVIASLRLEGHPFPAADFQDLESHQVRLPETDCTDWYGYTTTSGQTITPYYYTKPIPGYPLKMPARQLFVAKHLNVDPLCLPRRFKISTICSTPLCTTLAHLIPYNYYARTRRGTLIIPDQKPTEHDIEFIKQLNAAGAFDQPKTPTALDILARASGRPDKEG